MFIRQGIVFERPPEADYFADIQKVYPPSSPLTKGGIKEGIGKIPRSPDPDSSGRDENERKYYALSYFVVTTFIAFVLAFLF